MANNARLSAVYGSKFSGDQAEPPAERSSAITLMSWTLKNSWKFLFLHGEFRNRSCGLRNTKVTLKIGPCATHKWTFWTHCRYNQPESLQPARVFLDAPRGAQKGGWVGLITLITLSYCPKLRAYPTTCPTLTRIVPAIQTTLPTTWLMLGTACHTQT